MSIPDSKPLPEECKDFLGEVRELCKKHSIYLAPESEENGVFSSIAIRKAGSGDLIVRAVEISSQTLIWLDADD